MCVSVASFSQCRHLLHDVRLDADVVHASRDAAPDVMMHQRGQTELFVQRFLVESPRREAALATEQNIDSVPPRTESMIDSISGVSGKVCGLPFLLRTAGSGAADFLAPCVGQYEQLDAFAVLIPVFKGPPDRGDH
jgi:hypothetical protein